MVRLLTKLPGMAVLRAVTPQLIVPSGVRARESSETADYFEQGNPHEKITSKLSRSLHGIRNSSPTREDTQPVTAILPKTSRVVGPVEAPDPRRRRRGSSSPRFVRLQRYPADERGLFMADVAQASSLCRGNTARHGRNQSKRVQGSGFRTLRTRLP